MGCSTGGCGCSSSGGGGCNKFNVYDWLAHLPAPSIPEENPYVEVSFRKGSRKDYFLNKTQEPLQKGDWVVVDGDAIGFDIGSVSLTGYLVRRQMEKKKIELQKAQGLPKEKIKEVLCRATEKDMKSLQSAKQKEHDTLVRARTLVRILKLDMKLSQVEIQADERKAVFYYISDKRVDFRELIKRYAEEFLLKVEMRQVSSRKEAGLVGGLGSCGRELCCSSWLHDPKTVNISAARYQGLSINTDKLNGQCGRLKCCLNYELETYVELTKLFPSGVNTLSLQDGKLKLVKKDILKKWMIYQAAASGQHIALSIGQVKKMQTKKFSIDEVKKHDLYAQQEKKKPKQLQEELYAL